MLGKENNLKFQEEKKEGGDRLYQIMPRASRICHNCAAICFHLRRLIYHLNVPFVFIYSSLGGDETHRANEKC